jgi:hypothetical protein
MINFRNFFSDSHDRELFIKIAKWCEQNYIEENGKTFSKYNQVFERSLRIIWRLYRYQPSVISGASIGKDNIEYQNVAKHIHDNLNPIIDLNDAHEILDAFINIGLLNVTEKEEEYQLEDYKFGIKQFFCKFNAFEIYDFEEFKTDLEFKDINDSEENLKELYYNYIFRIMKGGFKTTIS